MVELASLLAAASLGLAQPPYLGIACRTPNGTTCGRIGVAVWLRRPARSVHAELLGKRVRLRAGGLGGKGPKYWQGFVRVDPRVLDLPAHWAGVRPTRIIRLRLRIDRRSGVVRGTVRVPLRPGWG